MYKYKLTSLTLKHHFQKKNNVLVFEDSDLSAYECEHIYACDQSQLKSLQIENINTKNTVTFKFDSQDKDPNGELAGTNYKSKDGLKLLIIND